MIQYDFSGDVTSRKFDYIKNEKPTVVRYLYGAVKIVRPVLVIDKNGKLHDRYEIAWTTFDLAKEKMLKYADSKKLQEILNFLVSDEEFDNLKKHISKNI